MHFLLLGSDYFREALQTLGCRTTWVGTHVDCDLPPPENGYDLPAVIDSLPDRPDAVLLTDDLGRRIAPYNIQNVDIPKIYYAVDSPINAFWQAHLVPLFDLILVDQQAEARRWAARAPGRVHWLPVAVDVKQYQGPKEKKQFDLAFVGAINERVRPKRSRIIDMLAKRCRVVTAGARGEGFVHPKQAAKLYRQAHLVLNENLFDGVTTRMFEAAAAGGFLLTESPSTGLNDLFTPDLHYAAYGPADLVDRVDSLLADPGRLIQGAAAAREKAVAEHDITHRAADLLRLFPTATRPISDPIGADLGQGKALFWIAARWPRHDGARRMVLARRFLFKAHEGGGIDAAGLFHLGAAHRLLGEPMAADRFWRQAADAGEVRAIPALAFLHGPGGSDLKRLAETVEAHGVAFPAGRAADGPLTPDQHLAVGRFLESVGRDMTPGFARQHLDMSLFHGLEHYLAALAAQPGHAGAMKALGDLLARRGLWVEAHHVLSQAQSVRPTDPALAEAVRRAGRKAYLDPPEARKRAAV